MSSFLRRAWYGMFLRQAWTLGFAQGTLGADPGWLARGRLLPPLKGGDFLADPFFVPGTGGRVVLCEWNQGARGKGIIARLVLNARGEVQELSELIQLPRHHLSYPHVFSHAGTLYCCPESCHTRTVKLFTLSPDASKVLACHTMLEGFASVDPTVFEFEGRWWLMCTSAQNGQSNSHLYAFHAPEPHGPWTAHAANPIVTNVAGARPAGRVYEHANRYYRPAQDCSQRYGGGLRLFRIEELTPDTYRETACWSLAPPGGEHGRHGVHTVNESEGMIVYDAYTERFSPIAWGYRLKERFR